MLFNQITLFTTRRLGANTTALPAPMTIHGFTASSRMALSRQLLESGRHDDTRILCPVQSPLPRLSF